MGVAVDILSWIFIGTGGFFILTGAIGVLRLPDVYTRMHATSVIDTAGALLLVVGLGLQSPSLLIVFKLIVVLALLFFTGPVASHAIAQAALEAGVEPKLDEDRTDRVVPGGDVGDIPPDDQMPGSKRRDPNAAGEAQ